MSGSLMVGVAMRWSSLLLLFGSLCAAQVHAEVTGETVGECVPFARAMSGIQLYGNAWTWWTQADGRYARGTAPRVGAVLVFRPTGAMRLGHVAVVSQVIGPRVVMVTHSNWSRIDGTRGQVERDVTMTDTSEAGNWSRVRVWYHQNEALGGTSYPTYGFIYGAPVSNGVRTAAPSPRLSGPSPDIIGAVIDSIG
ncbi:CHAP domain-containing protein [Sphingomonas montana]|uniref:CHAP domain-containing protein n=1 Tax=Sphingomonas montana TaxID=1843236 RepID=UPI001F0A886B|nr:CHAP domain-containing protein [Sphingomonas montana]